MKPPMDDSEKELRSRFDFSRGVRGKFAKRYRQGHSATVLEGEHADDDPLDLGRDDSQLTEIAGKHLLIAHLINAGFEVAEPIRDKGIDLVAYRGAPGSDEFVAWPIQLKASAHESFSLERKYASLPRLLIAYVWNVNTPDRSEIYVLTFEDAVEVLEKKKYAQTESWTKAGRYFVRDAGEELKEHLEPFRMTRERWQEKLRAA